MLWLEMSELVCIVNETDNEHKDHDGEKLVKTVRSLIKQSDFQLIQKLVKSQCLHLITQ